MRRHRRKYEVERDGARDLKVKALDAKHAMLIARLKHTGLRITTGEIYAGLTKVPAYSEPYRSMEVTDLYRGTVYGLPLRMYGVKKGTVDWSIL